MRNISRPQNTYCRVKSKENRSRKNRFSALLSIQTHINSQNELVLSNSLKPVVCSSIRSSVWQNHLWARRALALRRKYICQFTYISRCSLLKEPFYFFLVSLPWYSLVNIHQNTKPLWFCVWRSQLKTMSKRTFFILTFTFFLTQILKPSYFLSFCDWLLIWRKFLFV